MSILTCQTTFHAQTECNNIQNPPLSLQQSTCRVVSVSISFAVYIRGDIAPGGVLEYGIPVLFATVLSDAVVPLLLSPTAGGNSKSVLCQLNCFCFLFRRVVGYVGNSKLVTGGTERAEIVCWRWNIPTLALINFLRVSKARSSSRLPWSTEFLLSQSIINLLISVQTTPQSYDVRNNTK